MVEKSASKFRERIRGFKLTPWKILFIGAGILIALGLGTPAFYYHRFSDRIDARLSGKLLRSESRIFTAPKRIAVGQAITPEQLAAYLQTEGYSAVAGAEAAGQIAVTGSSIEIRPSANPYFAGKTAPSVNSGRSGLPGCVPWTRATGYIPRKWNRK